MKNKEFNWKDINLSKEVIPVDVINKRGYGSQHGERWTFKNNKASFKSMFSGRGIKK